MKFIFMEIIYFKYYDDIESLDFLELLPYKKNILQKFKEVVNE